MKAAICGDWFNHTRNFVRLSMHPPTLTPPHDHPLFSYVRVVEGVLHNCGSSLEKRIGVMVAQLIAIPVLLYALAQLWCCGRLRPVRSGITFLIFIVSIPLL